jgi:hypothetical protein
MKQSQVCAALREAAGIGPGEAIPGGPDALCHRALKGRALAWVTRIAADRAAAAAAVTRAAARFPRRPAAAAGPPSRVRLGDLAEAVHYIYRHIYIYIIYIYYIMYI